MTNTSVTLSNGAQMPMLGLGTWKAPGSEVGQAVEYALLEAGYRHIDCAKIYGNEKEIGEIFASVFSSNKVKREDVFITSKLWNNEHDPAVIEQACLQTLADLQLDYLDLYLIHWGIAFVGGREPEPVAPEGGMELGKFALKDTWQAMELLVEKGLVKAIGVANYPAVLLTDLLSYAKVRPAINQIELHPYNAQPELVEYCQKCGVAVTAYSPLGNRSRVAANDTAVLEEPIVQAIAADVSKTPAQVLLRWGVQRRTVVIPKSVTPARISENAAIFDFELNDEQMSRLNSIDRRQRLVNPSEWWGVPYFA